MPSQQQYKKMSIGEFSSFGERLQSGLTQSLQNLQSSSTPQSHRQFDSEYNKLKKEYARWYKAFEQRFPRPI